MVNSQKIKDEIRNEFLTLSDKQDLVKVLNLANFELSKTKNHPIPLKKITYYANPKLAKNRYKTFDIPKKSGGVRIIQAPKDGLKFIQTCLSFVLECVFENHFNNSSFGFISGKSIVDNAQRHTGKNYVFNIDIKDFFSSIDQKRVKHILTLPPFNLNGEKEKIAFLISCLCCHQWFAKS
jgi:RNA-directed DNA polymerase